MSGLLARAGALFVAPAGAAAFAPPRPRSSVVGVLAGERDLFVLAGAEAAARRRAEGSGFALVCVHGAAPPYGPAAPAASRAVAKLARRDIDARACGTLCVTDVEDARAAIAALDAPVVVAAARRDAAVDALLAGAERLVLGAGPDALLTDLAAEDLARLGPPVSVVTAPAGLIARRAARLGLATHDGSRTARQRCAS